MQQKIEGNAPEEIAEKLHPFMEKLLKVTVYNPAVGYVWSKILPPDIPI